MIRRLLLGILSAAAGGACVSAADWPQWRGSARDGKSADTGLLKAWPEGGPKLAWKAEDVGTGYGQPAVVGDKIYLVGASTDKKDGVDSVTCLSSKDGSPLWTKEIGTSAGNYLDRWGGGPRSTPTVDGDHLYVLGATGDLVCLKAADGAKVWQKNLVKDFGGAIPQWGYSESVLIDGDVAVVSPGKAAGMIALDKKTGATKWTCTEMKDGAGYSSVMVANVGDVKLYVQQSMEQAYGVDAKSGKLLWKTGNGIGRRTAVIPTPVIDGSLAFFTAGYGAGCEAVEMTADGKGGVTGTVKYKQKTFQNHHGGVIAHNGMMFGHSDAGNWTCYDYKAGPKEAKWQNAGVGKGSITYADGRFYCYSERSGTLALIDANVDEYKEFGKLTIPAKSKKRPQAGQIWPHPVVANGILYVRDYELLYAYNVKAAAE